MTDHTSLISWNVRGLNTRAQRDVVCMLVDDIKAMIVCLQEMKLNLVSVDVTRSLYAW
jgi:exonuclease III